MRLHCGFRLGDVRNTLAALAQFWTTVRHTEHLSENEVVVRADHVSLTHHCAEFFSFVVGQATLFAHFSTTLNNGVGSSDSTVAALPNAGRSVGTHTHGHVLEAEQLVVGSRIRRKIVANAIRVWGIVVDYVIG